MHKSDGNSGERERHQADDTVSDRKTLVRWLSPPKDQSMETIGLLALLVLVPLLSLLTYVTTKV